ncbi:MAG: RHS repeat-associated core domain-containing protein, partial [Bacteroidota bacterium]
QDGFIYVWVSNESEATKVFFDDLKITHQGVMVTQATDYGSWGDILREQKTDESVYRFGYQGQFSERDLETGWSHFELREYDAIIGRWTVTDPYGEYWSPYIGMGNDPINLNDPNGGSVTNPGKMAFAAINILQSDPVTNMAMGGAIFLPEVVGAETTTSGLASNLLDDIFDMLPGDRYNGSEAITSVGTNFGGGIKKGYEVTFNPMSQVLYQMEKSNTKDEVYVASDNDGVMRLHTELGAAWQFVGAGYKRVIETDDETGHLDGLYNSDVSEFSITIRGLTMKWKWGSEGRSFFYGLKAGVGGGIGIGGSAEAWHGNVIKY